MDRRSTESTCTVLEGGPEHRLVLLAGSARGARWAVDQVMELVEEGLRKPGAATVHERMLSAFSEANAALLDARERGERSSVGVGLAVVQVKNNVADMAWLGGGSIYLVRAGDVTFRNTEPLEEHGGVHLGESGGPDLLLTHLSVANLNLDYGDILLVCSDSLRSVMQEWELGNILRGATAPEAARAVVDEAMARGLTEPLTIVVLLLGCQHCPGGDPWNEPTDAPHLGRGPPNLRDLEPSTPQDDDLFVRLVRWVVPMLLVLTALLVGFAVYWSFSRAPEIPPGSVPPQQFDAPGTPAP